MEFANYRVIHWFFNKQALEFLNIGVVVFTDDGEFLFKMIDEKLLAKIEANFINKTILSYTINHISSFLEKCKNGKGLALAFKTKYPAHFENYKRACQNGEMTTDKVLAYQEKNGPMIICLATKADWKDSSKIEYVSAGLDDLVNQIKALGIRSVAIPKLGCGLGGLDWGKVRPLIVEKMSAIDGISVEIYE